VAAIPALTMTAEWLAAKYSRRGITFKPRRWFGVFISMAGVAAVAGVSFVISGNITGYFYMGGAALCWVVYGFLTRPLFNGHSRIFVVFWQNLFGFLGFIPFTFFEFSKWGTPNMPVLLHILFLAVCCSALGYWLYAYSLEILGVSVSSSFINLIPVVTIIAGFFILGERLTVLQWFGAALVLAGVYLTASP
jgi:drug/metabolite transporter (DMT)-like permease